VVRILLQILKWLGIALVTIVVGLSLYVWRTWDRVWDIPLPDLQASADPAVVARGQYLAYGPAHCAECHMASAEVFERYVETGVRQPLSGGYTFAVPPLGAIYSANLTPDPETGIGRYSDPQIARMLRYAVKPNGRASIQPAMPYGDMSDEDVVAIISFLRSEAPVRNGVRPAEWTVVGKAIKSLAPTFKPRTDDEIHPPKTSPPAQPNRARGEYIVRSLGNCLSCHSPLNQMTFVVNGPEFSGGLPIEPRGLPNVDHSVWFAPPNLTPLAGSALLRFPDRETFVARFQKGGRKYPASPMPWNCYDHMTADDIGAVYEFLYSVPAAGKPAPEDPRVQQD
jgi:mono/diheme cytochrome c family protein